MNPRACGDYADLWPLYMLKIRGACHPEPALGRRPGDYHGPVTQTATG